jgi:hypothetical protein
VPKKASVCTVVLALTLFPSMAAWSTEADSVSMRRIEREVPPLIAPVSSIARIEIVEVGPTKRTKKWAITDPEKIAKICVGLRDAIDQEQFKIGLQVFSPKEVREVTFIRDGRPALHLIHVGGAQFWMSWGEAMRARDGEINFQSKQFEKIADEFFPLSRFDPSVPTDFALMISRGGCEGSCPIYSIRLDERGEVVWNGKQDVRRKGVARKTIGRFQLQDIVMAARDREVMSFGRTARLCLDTPAVKITLTMDGKTATADHDSCSQEKTSEGQALAEFVDYAEIQMDIVGWVKGN